jgi:hypothetical protein
MEKKAGPLRVEVSGELAPASNPSIPRDILGESDSSCRPWP